MNTPGSILLHTVWNCDRNFSGPGSITIWSIVPVPILNVLVPYLLAHILIEVKVLILSQEHVHILRKMIIVESHTPHLQIYITQL